MFQNLHLLIFDLDFLVFDPSALKLRALRQSLISFAETMPADIRLPDAIDAEEGYREHGFRWMQFLEIGLHEEGLSQLQQAYRRQEDRLLSSGIGNLCPGVAEFLSECSSAGVDLAIGADASREYLMSVADHITLYDLFDAVLCTEEFGVGSSEEMFEEIMRQRNVNPSETIVLGTRPAAFRSAHLLDILTVGCGWGIHQQEGLAEADFQCPTLSSLPAILREADATSLRYS